MNPIKRAAQALCELDNNPPGAMMDGKPLWQDYLPEVRAVLAAIREDVSENALSAGALQLAEGDGVDVSLPQLGAAWARMIDVIMEEQPLRGTIGKSHISRG